MIRRSIADITKMNHVRCNFLKPGNYTVQNSVVSASQYSLEAGNLIYGSIQQDECMNFARCVQPVINEKALEPAQIALFEAMYNHDYLRR